MISCTPSTGRMRLGLERIRVVQPAVDQSLEGSSSWLRVAREKAAEREKARPKADPGREVIAKAFERARRFEPASAPVAEEPAAAHPHQPAAGRTSVLDSEARGRDAG
jgi:hypothetical protein